MLTRLISAARGLRSSRRKLVGAAVSMAVAPAALGVSLVGGGEPASPSDPEPVLNVASSGVSPERESPDRSREARPVADEVESPRVAQGARAISEDEPPAHIAREDARLRKELAHLKAIQAESRRVARSLRAAGIPAGALLGTGRLIWPVNGTLTSPFGMRWGRLHAGIDIGAAAGTPIRAADSGRVILAGSQGGYGLYTCIQHTASLSTCYAHQSRLGTSAGASVRRGQVIGYVGNTGHSFGNHLHFETRVDGQPVDPMGFL